MARTIQPDQAINAAELLIMYYMQQGTVASRLPRVTLEQMVKDIKELTYYETMGVVQE